jgi:hypothetical protein
MTVPWIASNGVCLKTRQQFGEWVPNFNDLSHAFARDRSRMFVFGSRISLVNRWSNSRGSRPLALSRSRGAAPYGHGEFLLPVVSALHQARVQSVKMDSGN